MSHGVTSPPRNPKHFPPWMSPMDTTSGYPGDSSSFRSVADPGIPITHNKAQNPILSPQYPWTPQTAFPSTQELQTQLLNDARKPTSQPSSPIIQTYIPTSNTTLPGKRIILKQTDYPKVKYWSKPKKSQAKKAFKIIRVTSDGNDSMDGKSDDENSQDSDPSRKKSSSGVYAFLENADGSVWDPPERDALLNDAKGYWNEKYGKPDITLKEIPPNLYVARCRRSRGMACLYRRSPSSTSTTVVENAVVRNKVAAPAVGNSHAANSRSPLAGDVLDTSKLNQSASTNVNGTPASTSAQVNSPQASPSPSHTTGEAILPYPQPLNQ
ncbi:hypothetical protein L218DRAFT_1007005 [Marasmius fiardii PR-910]|nr:hypothetical protein L218DRAFT_1007005 [Marasmius fiardii PR-910]